MLVVFNKNRLATVSSPFKPSKTIRIFSSALNLRRVFRLISRTTFSGSLFLLNGHSFVGWILLRSVHYFRDRICLTLADGLQESEDHSNRQGGLDGQVPVGALSARSPTGRSSPGIERSIRKPDGQVTALLEALFAFRPIPYPILRPRVLVLASLRILHRWRLRGRVAGSSRCHPTRSLHQRPSNPDRCQTYTSVGLFPTTIS